MKKDDPQELLQHLSGVRTELPRHQMMLKQRLLALHAAQKPAPPPRSPFGRFGQAGSSRGGTFALTFAGLAVAAAILLGMLLLLPGTMSQPSQKLIARAASTAVAVPYASTPNTSQPGPKSPKVQGNATVPSASAPSSVVASTPPAQPASIAPYPTPPPSPAPASVLTPVVSRVVTVAENGLGLDVLPAQDSHPGNGNTDKDKKGKKNKPAKEDKEEAKATKKKE